MREFDFVTEKDLRSKAVENELAIAKMQMVKELLLLDGTELATTEMVATYYDVKSIETINSVIKDHREELENNGLKVYKGSELANSDVMSFKDFTRNRANYKFELNDGTTLSVGGKGITLFTKRAILNVGMLLRDSDVAIELRSRLLDIVHDADKGIGNTQTVVEEIDETTRLIDLKCIPKNSKGYNWKESIGRRIEFIYNNIKGVFEIVDYKPVKQQLILKYEDKILWDKPIRTGDFCKCKIGGILSVYTKNFKKNIYEQIKDDKRDLIIIDREYRRVYKKKGNKYENQKWYKYRCNKCNNEDWVIEHSLCTQNTGCNICNATAPKAKLGINTIWDTDRWMVDLGMSERDAQTHTKACNDKILVKCPNCKKDKSCKISDIYSNKSIGCTCGDGFSYPEKFITSMLTQLNIKFDNQLSKDIASWCKEYKYDFYMQKYNTIIEAHGLQHYEESNRGRTLAEEQENDEIKKKLALNNGIQNYVVLDCRYSDLDYIKNSILNSELAKLLDLSTVDWLKCEEFALKNIVKEVCNYWNNKEKEETTQTIAENNPWGIKSKETICRYLKKGVTLGWTNYNPKEEMIKSAVKVSKITSKQVEIFKDGISLGVFESCAELSRQSKELFGVKLSQGNISSVCIGKRSHHKGFIFKYI